MAVGSDGNRLQLELGSIGGKKLENKIFGEYVISISWVVSLALCLINRSTIKVIWQWSWLGQMAAQLWCCDKVAQWCFNSTKNVILVNLLVLFPLYNSLLVGSNILLLKAQPKLTIQYCFLRNECLVVKAEFWALGTYRSAPWLLQPDTI